MSEVVIFLKTKMKYIRNSHVELQCPICGMEVSNAHQCKMCRQYVHAICGEHDPRDGEGYGKPVICNFCLSNGEILIHIQND